MFSCISAPLIDRPASGARDDAKGKENDDDFQKRNKGFRDKGLALALSDPLKDFIILKMIATVFMCFTVAMLAMSGEEWETKQRQAEAEATTRGETGPFARQYRVLVLAEGTMEKQFFLKLRYLMHEIGMWALIPFHHLTEEVNASIFRLCSRSGCLVEEMIAFPNRLFPIRIFLLIRRPELAAHFRTLPDCVLGPFAVDFLRQNPDLGSLLSRLRLVVIALVLRTDIVTVEVLHAAIRRWLMALSQHTHKMEFSDCDDLWLMKMLRRRMRQAKTWFAKVQVPFEAGSDVPADVPAEDMQVSDLARRGGGGRWRAFISLEDAGKLRDFADLGMRWRALSEEERRRYEPLGILATDRHRTGAQGSSFGCSVGDVSKQIAIQRKEQVAHSMDAMIAVENAKSVLVSKIVGRFSSDRIGEALVQARSQNRLFNKAKRQAAEAHAANHIKFVNSECQRHILTTMLASSALAPITNDCCIVPHRGVQTVELHTNIAALAGKLLSFCQTHRTEDGFYYSSILDAHAQRSRRPIKAAECKPPAPKAVSAAAAKAAAKHSKCADAGRCLCTPEGRILFRLRNSFLKCLKLSTPNQTPERTLVRDGYLFAAILPRDVKDPIGKLGGDPASDPPPPAKLFDGGFFIHIGVLYLKPYRPTFLAMKVVDTDPDWLFHLQAGGAM